MTVSPKRPSDHEQQLLSSYLDGALPRREKEMLEQRLAADPALRAELEHLRETVALLRDLPRLKPPHDFTLDPRLYARPLPWWKRLFTLEMALQFSGALGAAAAMVLIVAAVLLTQDADRLDEKPSAGEIMPDQQASQVALQITATALRRTLSYDDTALAEETRIGFAGEEFQSTMAAQSAYYATHLPTATLVPGLTEAPAAGPTIGAAQAESEISSTEGLADGDVGAVPSAQQAAPAAPLGAEETTMMQDEGYSPAEAADSAAGAAPPPEPGLVEPPAGFAPPMSGTPAAENAFRERDEDDGAEAQEALDNEPAITQTPLEAAAVASATPQSNPSSEKRGTDSSEEEPSPDWRLIVVGVMVLAASGLLFGIGRRMARG